MRLFDNQSDYAAFEQILLETLAAIPMRICAFCVMPNHWHFVLWPEADDHLSAFMQRLTLTHASRWQAFRDSTGTGHVYQGRFKSFPVECDEHFYRVARYVERNALRAGLVRRVRDWRWSSSWIRDNGTPELQALLSPWPIPMQTDWETLVETPHTDAEPTAVRQCIESGRPFGSDLWTRRIASELGLESTLRGRGRPRKDFY